jgi:hypothetical protein
MSVETDPNVDASIRNVTNLAFLELYPRAEHEKRENVSLDDLVAEANAQERKGFRYRWDYLSNYFREYFSKNHAALKQKICDEWKYCEKLRAWRRPGDFFAALADLAMLLGDVFSPWTLMWLFLTRVLDELCECPERLSINIRQVWAWLRRNMPSSPWRKVAP